MKLQTRSDTTKDQSDFRIRLKGTKRDELNSHLANDVGEDWIDQHGRFHASLLAQGIAIGKPGLHESRVTPDFIGACRHIRQCVHPGLWNGVEPSAKYGMKRNTSIWRLETMEDGVLQEVVVCVYGHAAQKTAGVRGG